MLAIRIVLPKNRASTTAPMVNQLVWPGAASVGPLVLKRAFHFSGVMRP
jgi:hypothetical protein